MATPTISKRPAQHSPPDRSGKKSKAEEANCLVCEKVILEVVTRHYSVKANARAGFTDNVLELRVWAMTSLVSQPYLFYVIIVHWLNTIMKLTC